jgi:hypothetical protein
VERPTNRQMEFLVSGAIGTLITGCAALPFDASQSVLLPGVIISLVAWPAGVHSDFGFVGPMRWLVVICIGSWLVWSALTFFVLSIYARVA